MDTHPAVGGTPFRPVSRETAEDRWLGLMLDRVDPNVPSDLSDRLQAVLVEIVGGMSREPAKEGGEVQDLTDAISAWLVRWTESGGISPKAEEGAA